MDSNQLYGGSEGLQGLDFIEYFSPHYPTLPSIHPKIHPTEAQDHQIFDRKKLHNAYMRCNSIIRPKQKKGEEMSAANAVSNILVSLQALQESIAPEQWADTPLPVIVSPSWWLADVARELSAEPGVILDSIHGCQVLEQSELSEPFLLTHEGKLFPVLPAWQRPKKSADASAS